MLDYTGEDACKLRFMDSVPQSVRLEAALTSYVGGSWERNRTQRTAKRYDDDGDGEDVWLRLLLLLAALIMATRTLPPQTNRRRMSKKGHWAKILAALRRVTIRSSIVCFQPILTV